MTTEAVFKTGQVLGALVIALGAGACALERIESTPFLMIIGITLYCGCWLGALVWPREASRTATETQAAALSGLTQTPAD